MQNSNMNIRPQQAKQQDPIEMIKKYTSLLWSKKLWIVVITTLISVLWFFVSPLLMKAPKYTSSVIIKFDDPRYSRNVSAVTDFAQEQIQGKVALLYTNSLLEQVVDSLQLNVRVGTKGISRFSFFKNIQIDNNAEFGKYELIYDNDLSKVNVYYTNKPKNAENKLIVTTDFHIDSKVAFNVNGLSFMLNQNEFINNNEIVINYIPKRFIVDGLKQQIDRNLDRSRTVLTVSYADRDPEVSAAVTNMVSNVFVNKLLDYKKFRTTSILNSLEDQLRVSRNELDISENRLREFRERNPFLMLSREGSNFVTQLSDKQNELSSVEQSLERINYLIESKGDLTGESRNSAYQEILSAISARDLNGSQVILDQYSNLMNEKSRLLEENYSEDHMLIQDVSLRLSNMQSEIDIRVNQFVNQLQSQKTNLERTVTSSEQNIRRLPRNELRLAQLERDRQVKSDIYSNVLVRYNEAKVADASVIPDAFIIEEAKVPLAFSGTMVDNLKKTLLGPLLGLVLGIGLFIVLDFLDKSIKNSDEVEAKLGIKVLATIPIIMDEKETPVDIEKKRQLEEKLITSNYAPTIANEKFRLLRTKLFMQGKQVSPFIVTSLSPGEGKSLVSSNLAITFAQQKISTLLIDCDLRRGVLHNSFNCNKKPGISDILVKNNPITQSDISHNIQNTHVPNLFIMSSGLQVPNPSEILGSVRMKQLLESLKDKFSMIIIDTPPIEFISDALVLNSVVHNILFIVRYNKTNLNKLTDKIVEFSNVKDDFKGIVINASAEADMEKYETYSYYHY